MTEESPAMNAPGETSYGSDDVMKPGWAARLSSSLGCIIGTSPPVFQRLVLASPIVSASPPSESKLQSSHYQWCRGLDIANWIPMRRSRAAICVLSLFALSGPLFFANCFLNSSQNRGSDGTIAFYQSWRLYGTNRELDLKDDSWKTAVRIDCHLPILKVFMYDLPSEFHFGMLDDFEPSPNPLNVWPRNISDLPRYPGGLYQQHSIEYWLTADILTSNHPDRGHECTAIRVENPSEAEIFYVPFFASLSYEKYAKRKTGNEDLNKMLQYELMNWLKKQRPWQESGGTDHMLVVHHPNSLSKVKEELSSAMFVLCDFGRFPETVANTRKDIVAPHKHVMASYVNDSSTFESRELLLFFQGKIIRKDGGAIRKKLQRLLKGEEEVQFLPGNTQSDGIKSATLGMRNSKFCLHVAGDTPSSNRLFDAIVNHCVPVVILDAIELPYRDVLNYSDFCIFVPARLALKRGVLITLLRGIEKEEWTRMWRRMHQVALHFEYQHPTKPDDAVNMLWMAIARRRASFAKEYADEDFLGYNRTLERTLPHSYVGTVM